jgi:lysophospholipase L1-like esterase
MKRLGVRRLAGLLAAAAVLLGLPLAGPAAPAQAAAVRVMPLGDSITGGPGCWRALLWTKLQATGYTNVDFVGTLPGGGCNVASWDGDNEGHGGYLAINVAQQNLLAGWLSATHPDVVMMHFGTNDIWNRKPTADIIAAFSTLVDQMRASNPNMKILVAQIIPVAPSGCDTCQQATVDLNAAIPGWARSESTAASPIIVVDHWTGWVPAADTIDGVHQSDAGNQKMSDRWYPALTAVLGGGPGTTTTTTTHPATTTTTSTRPTTTTTRLTTTTTRAITTTTTTGPTTGGQTGCSAALTVGSAWNGGFVASVKVTAAAAVSGWKVALALPSGTAVTNAWNGVASGTTGTVTVTNASYNGALAAGQGTEFGFQGNGSAIGITLSCTPA